MNEYKARVKQLGDEAELYQRVIDKREAAAMSDKGATDRHDTVSGGDVVVTVPLERYERLVLNEKALLKRVEEQERRLVSYERHYHALAEVVEGRISLVAMHEAANWQHKVVASVAVPEELLMRSRGERLEILRTAGETLAEALLVKIAKAESAAPSAHRYRIPGEDYELPDEVLK